MIKVKSKIKSLIVLCAIASLLPSMAHAETINSPKVESIQNFASVRATMQQITFQNGYLTFPSSNFAIGTNYITGHESETNNRYVKALQACLKYWGYNCGTIDGKFGTNTYNKVVAFQRAYGLTADGVAGFNTLAKISNLLLGKKVPYTMWN